MMPPYRVMLMPDASAPAYVSPNPQLPLRLQPAAAALVNVRDAGAISLNGGRHTGE